MDPPLVVDIDGTLSRADRSIDGRVFETLREWDAPVVVATGKAPPYPVALCQFAGIRERVVAENGGVVLTRDTERYLGDREGTSDVAAALRERGVETGWGGADLVNRWRETELAVSREAPLDAVREVAADHGLAVVDTGFAYHVKDPDVSKGEALRTLAADLGRPPEEFLAVGDSANDVSTFAVAGCSVAVANADDAAREAADEVTDGAYGEGFLEAAERARR